MFIKTLHKTYIWFLVLTAVVVSGLSAKTLEPLPPEPIVIYVSNRQELVEALAVAQPNTHILLQPGVYQGGIYSDRLQGTASQPFVIGAANPSQKPVISGGSQALQLSDPAYVELRDLIVENMTANGINIDDGGTYDTPAHHITLNNLEIRNVGTGGNQDGIKLSGVEDFRVNGALIEFWGTGGSGIDMVGCRRGVIERSTFRHGDTAGSNGVQAKGGSRDILVRASRFEHAGLRAVQIGGSTGLEFFRPQPPAGYEAKDITVENNVIIGSEAAIAFVNTDGAIVRYNTIYRPKRWVIRILQETTAPGFVPSRNGVFTRNIVAFRSDEISTTVNVGTGTAPETFQFARNWWYCLNNPANSTPSLPTPETEGIYGINPQFINAAAGDVHLQPNSPAQAYGAYATGTTAATVSISGRVTTAAGRGIAGARITLSQSNGDALQIVATNAFGYYRFNAVAGQSAVISLSAKKYNFSEPARVLNLTEDLSAVDFVAFASR